jgi:adenylylsulfate reductase subunit B
MSIAIDRNKCVGCGSCMEVCPGSLIKKDTDGKAFMKYPRDCWGCCSCIKECKFDAIALYLGADIGGMGSHMSVRADDRYINWNIAKTDGSVETIVTDKKESNKY